MQAVQTLGFEPDYAAQAMRSRATNTMGCMVSDISNPLYGDIVNGAEEEFQRAGYVMMLGATKHEADRETALLSIVRRRRMDGLLMLAGFNDQPAFKEFLENLDCPVSRSIATFQVLPRCAAIIAGAAMKQRAT